MSNSEIPRRVILAGGSGFLGRAIFARLSKAGFAPIVLTRSREPKPQHVHWDGKTVGDWWTALEDAYAIVNLTGKSIDCRNTPENRRALIDSRTDAIRALADAFRRCANPPSTWVQASAVGFYGDTGNAICGDNCPAGADMLAEICQIWEGEFEKQELSNLRKVTLRIGVVLGKDGGILQKLAWLTRLFLGGAAGSGRQYISWLHVDDLCRIVGRTIDGRDMFGVYNATSPNPVTNAIFMKQLRKTLNRPWSPPVPEFAVRLGAFLLGTNPSLALIGQRCIPTRLLEMGFEFQFPDLDVCLDNLISRTQHTD